AKDYDVTVFEANDYIGGHTDTHDVEVLGKTYRIDTGFIVFNELNYPNFSHLLHELNVDSIDTEMSFSVHNSYSGLEYNATNLNKLFCQRKNLFNPRFYRMLKDLSRFYREAPALLDEPDNTESLHDYLSRNDYSDSFINDHLVPMACALWSGSSLSLMTMPARFLIAFMANHKMLSVSGRPQWRVVKGGSNRYVEALLTQFPGTIKTASPVQAVNRLYNGVSLRVNGEQHTFDSVVFACHSDQALKMLSEPSQAEQEVLGGIAYQSNHMQLHADETILPNNPNAWASWNAHVSEALKERCTVSYHMNTLQQINAPIEFIVSLNSAGQVDPNKVFLERHYSHPVYNEQTLQSQKRWSDISGHQHSYFCGAYWGWGFHEDGVKSALNVVEQIKAGTAHA
ncbi:NAD(P)/FAD-dependent oxidoreductase, partial [Methylophaga sp.]|uniref:NAD(P)/FAD-dependent oxidoreductase n=1 Tax=Methylophaga sp. TaxID=2024840 RepID=UPI003F6969AA